MPNVLVRRLTLALLAASLSAPATAGFLDSKAEWDEISAAGKNGYVMGVWDETMILPMEATGLNAYRTDLNRCVGELELNAFHFVEIIDLQYQDVANWQFGPALVLGMGLRKACLDRINSYRAQRGEPPLS